MLCAFIVNTLATKIDDDEADQSLLYCSGSAQDKSCASNMLKGLSLAVRGALESLCGEKTSILRLSQHEPPSSSTVIAFTHCKVCMVALALPGNTSDATASSLALYLAQVMVACAGPSPSWLVNTSQTPSGGTMVKIGPARIKKTLLSLFDRLSEGVLQQSGQAKILPLITTHTGLLFMSLEEERQSALGKILKAHEVGGEGEGGVGGYSFYARQCFLSFRGLPVWSGLPPSHTRLIWQLCWALGAHSQTTALPCQIVTNRIHLDAASHDPFAVDSSLSSNIDDLPDITAGGGGGGGMGGQGTGADQQAHGGSQPSSLMILASACHMVLAVVLTAYDEEIEELAGQVEAQMAVELLSRVHSSFAADFEKECSRSSVLSSIARPTPPLLQGQGGSCPDLRIKSEGLSKSGGGKENLFMRIISRQRKSKDKETEAGSLAPPLLGTEAGGGGAGGGRGGGKLHVLGSKSLPRVRFEGVEDGSSTPGPSGLPPRSGGGLQLGVTPRGGLKGGSSARLASDKGPNLSSTQDPDLNQEDKGDKGKGGWLSRMTGSMRRSDPEGPRASPTSSKPSAARAGSIPLRFDPSSTYAVLLFDSESGRVSALHGELPHPSMMQQVWICMAEIRSSFSKGHVAVAAPPKHSRLCMTIQQIEQLAATRSQREGGQRLGSADSAPWMYHPEVGGLSATLQVTRKIPRGALLTWQQGLGQGQGDWFVSGVRLGEELEAFVVFSDEMANEVEVLAMCLDL